MMMRKFWPLLMAGSVGAMSVQAAPADTYELLVGSYTAGTSEGIYRLQFDSRTGKFHGQPVLAAKAANPSWLTLSKDQKHLFVVNENGPGQKDPVGRVSSYSVDPQNHQLTLINQVQSLGNEPTHSSLAADGRYLFVANYSVLEDPGGSLAVLPLDANGKLSPPVQLSAHPASRVNPERQASNHVHSVVSSPDGKHAWLTTEMSAQVAVFDYNDGTLSQTQLVDFAAGQPVSDKAGAALHASSDGKFLYVSNRGTANQMLVFSIDPATAHLKELQRRSVEGDHPREFSLDPSGKFLLIANQKSNEIVVVERDPKTGLLGKTVQKLAIDAPSDLKFLVRQ